MVNPIELKSRIINILAMRGPMLPMQFVKDLQVNSILVGALLSELLKDKKIKLSNMRVGGSPLYLLEGHEIHLEKFSNYLPSKEREALSLLKNEQILRDLNQEPAIRVALRSIKDFAKSFNFQNEIFWRYFTLSEQEAETLFTSKFQEFFKPEKAEPKQKEEQKEQTEPEIIEVIQAKEEIKLQKPIEPIQEKEAKPEKPKETPREKEERERKEKPLLTIRLEKPATKEKPDSEFIIKVRNFLKDSDIEILEEVEKKKKDFIAKVRVSSDVGKIEFICIAKEKKKITENDLAISMQKASSEKSPILLLSTGEPDKKAEQSLKSINLVKFKRI